MKFPLLTSTQVILICFACFALADEVKAQSPTNVDSSSVLVDFSADSLINGSSVSSWSPSSASDPENATVANATLNSVDTYHAPTVANTDAAFAGHNYVNFNTTSGHYEGLSTATNLGLTGLTNMSVAGVYATTSTPLDAGIAGLADLAGGGGTWFDLEDRTYLVSGNPYLAGYANDLNSGGSPAGESGQLTFALGTYSVSGTSATFSLYWAYGLTGAVNSVTATVSAVNTTTDTLELGYNAQDYNAGAGSPIELGQAVVYDTALSSADATTEIQDLQSFYAAEIPEPSTYALIGGSLLIGVIFLRRHTSPTNP